MSKPTDEPIREIVITLAVVEDKPSVAYDFESNLDEATNEDLMFLVTKLNNELQIRFLDAAIRRSRK